MPKMSVKMKTYFDKIDKEVMEIYEFANKAKAIGVDPSKTVECPPAKDMAGRVEKLVGPDGIGDILREWKKNGMSQDETCFRAMDLILERKQFPELRELDDEAAIDKAIRVALAIKTEGVVSAPLEGIEKVILRNDPLGGPKYISIFYAGPIRAAGGTVQALSVLYAEYVRKKMNIAPWKATETEANRMVEEVKLYDQCMSLQYPSEPEELKFAVENLNIELNGQPTEDREVSAYRDLKRIDTNTCRGGPCLVLNDGLLLKSKKILRVIETQKIEGWDWLYKLKYFSQKSDDSPKEDEKDKQKDYGGDNYKAKNEKENSALVEKELEIETPVMKRKKLIDEKNPPIQKFVADVIAGRPVFAGPSTIGGHRLRYGRSRNTGLAACGTHPSQMIILDKFMAVGTQIRIERPGKSGSTMPVTSIEPPIVLMKNGDVKQLWKIREAGEIVDKRSCEKILFVGDMLFGFGEFVENNHTIVPSGYVEEWWSLEIEENIKNFKKEGKNPFDNLPQSLSPENIHYFLQYPLDVKNPPNPLQSLEIAHHFGCGIHPRYLDHWGNVNGSELLKFRELFKQGLMETLGLSEESFNNLKEMQWKELDVLVSKGISIPFDLEVKKSLERGMILHLKRSDKIVIEHSRALTFIEILGFGKDSVVSSEGITKDGKDINEIAIDFTALDLFPYLTSLKVDDKCPIYMGSRMGRPEKAKPRKMKPPVQILFPIGHDSNLGRSFKKACERSYITVDVAHKYCNNCKEITFLNTCPNCNESTELKKICPDCKSIFPPEENKCVKCNGYLKYAIDRNIPLKKYYQIAYSKIGKPISDIKGVKGMVSEFKIPEPIEKGILRSYHEVWVYRDGTIRADATDIPLTHFTCREIETSVDKILELGYDLDIHGNPITDKDQIIEIKCQDVLLTDTLGDYFVKVANFVDDELKYLYMQAPFYNASTREDLIGQYMAGLAPHTSAAIIGRLIGFTKANSGYAHPFWHAAKRRNCLSRDEEVLIWDESRKELINSSIGDIVENMIKRGAKIQIVDDFGTISVENLNPHWKVISIDPDNSEQILQPIKHWIKGSSSHWIEITTRSGRKMNITDQHNMLKWNHITKKIEYVKAFNLSKGDKIPISSNLTLPKSIPKNEVNILKELHERLPFTLKFIKFKHNVRLRNCVRWMRTKIIQKFVDPDFNPKNKTKLIIPKPIRKIITEKLPPKPYIHCLTPHWFDSIPLSHVAVLVEMGVFEWNEIPHNAKIAMARDDKEFNPYLPFNLSLMRFLGYLISEGYIRDEDTCYQTNISAPNPELNEHIKELMVELFGYTPYEKTDNRQLCHTGRIHAYLFAYAWGIGKNAYQKRIPSWIFALPEDYRLEILAAFIDGDGSIPQTDDCILLYSVSKKLLKDFTILFNTLGVFVRKRKPTPIAHYGERIIKRYKELGKPPKQNQVHRISIRGIDLNVLSKINLKNTHKQKMSERIRNDGKVRNRLIMSSKDGLHELFNYKSIIFDEIDEINILRSKKQCYCLEVGKSLKTQILHNFLTIDGYTANCDGDEDGIMLLLDCLLNFSMFNLPSKLGGKMDAPLVISVVLDPQEVDEEAHRVDFQAKYPIQFYKDSLEYTKPGDIKYIKLYSDVLDTDLQYEGCMFTHPTKSINLGPKHSNYTVLDNMKDKIDAQMWLSKVITGIDGAYVASKVIGSHFVPDVLGNLRSFSTQGFRCQKCGAKYRRMPLCGKCRNCGQDPLLMTVHRGGITKYLDKAVEMIKEFNLGAYMEQRWFLIAKYVETLTNNPRVKQTSLSSFFK